MILKKKSYANDTTKKRFNGWSPLKPSVAESGVNLLGI